MDHALEPDRQFAQRRGRADRERLIELARQLHGRISSKAPVCRLEECKLRAKPAPAASASRQSDDRRPQSRAAVFRPDLPRLSPAGGSRTSPTAAWPGWISSSSTWRCRRCSTASWPRRRSSSSTTCRFIVDDHAGDLPGAGAVVRRRAARSAATWREATIAALAGAYGNIGYMGPGLALATLGRAGGGAGRADLLLRDAAVLLAGAAPDGAGAAVQRRARRGSRSKWCARSCCIRS